MTITSERLSKEQLKAISESYMQKIGFGEQPYLVYQHFDSGHPHIHIVLLKVRADGTRIDANNIGRNQSERARKEIEHDYGLVKAEDMKTKPYEPKSAYTQKVQYGRSDSRRAIANVLDGVLNTYRYTSLAELNAVLQQYNVLADRGGEGSRVHQNRGLLYRILDEKGNYIGVPIKASSFYNKPTLKYVEERFGPNEAARQAHKARVKNAIDLALLKQSKKSLHFLVTALEKEGIKAVIRQNKEGIIYGLTYVDHRTRCVFKGSDLGKQYSAKGIQERCGEVDITNQKAPLNSLEKTSTLQQQFSNGSIKSPDQKMNTNKRSADMQSQTEQALSNQDKTDLLNDLLQPEQTLEYVASQFKKTGKKKSKKRSNNL